MENEKIETNAENNKNQQNSNSEVKPRNKKVTIVLVSVIIVLLIAIGVCVGLWFAGDTTKIINNKEEVVKEENDKTEENKIEEEKQQQSNSKKIDEIKPWVYDADYSKDKENKIVEDYDFNKDVKVPYININSKDAEKVNNEIKNIYEEVYSKYGSKESNTYNGISWEVQMIYYVEYEYYENDNILSVVLRVADVAVNGGTGLSKLYVYNFDLNTLNVATFEEMAKLCGFTSTSEVIELINKWETKQNNFANFNEDAVSGTMMGVVDGQYFIDARKKLNFVYLLGAAGTYYTPSVIEPNTEIEDFYDFEDVKEISINTEIEKSNIQATPDEINQITQFLNKGENNGFVQQYYNVEDNARGLKMFNIIHAMQADVEEILLQEYTNEEVSELGLSTEQLHKISREKLDKYFKSKLGLGVLEIKDFDTTGFRYSEKYDAYYTSFGDSGHSEVTVSECSKDSTGKIWYVKGTVWEVQKFNLKLLKTQDGWQFLSNSQD